MCEQIDDNKKKQPKFNALKQKQVIELLTEGETFREACQTVNISRTTEWHFRRENDKYSQEVETALNIRTEAVENKLFEQCMLGNTTAIIFFLKTNNPQKYNIRQIQIVDDYRETFQVEELKMI